MILRLDPGVNRYYVQTLCMVFFPGAKFAVDEEITPETPIVTVNVFERKETVTARVTITLGEISVTAEDSQPADRHSTRIKPEKVALGAAFFKAGEKFFNYTPSWGILTGVRPTKIGLELIRNGYSSAEIKKILTKQYFLNPKKASLLMSVAANEEKYIQALAPNTCSVYISIPFCPSRCNYCSFVSYSTKRLLSMIPDYIETLCRDIDDTFALIKSIGMKVETVYVGGGTPSILTPEQITTVLDRVGKNVDVSSLSEFSFEAGRPETVTAEKLAAVKAGGVTRICVNPQTLNDSILESIGRGHTVADFYRAYDIACNSGIKCINTDLIAGLPGESFASFSRTVDAILELEPENVTLHTFCVKRAADIVRNDKNVYSRTGGTVGKCVDYAQLEAKNAGYMPYYMYRQKNTVGNYENVGFAREGYEGLYNIYMMEEVHSIFAIGAGAVSKMVSSDNSRIKRAATPKYPYEYLDPEIHDRSIKAIFSEITEFFAQ
ncbi:MAG: coproporphyrinogen dehydrogenase HemZ [Clostridia bacterium]|nr:coproporphyrinogen dehydrogenase HemZ [Clostridia bacterium]